MGKRGPEPIYTAAELSSRANEALRLKRRLRVEAGICVICGEEPATDTQKCEGCRNYVASQCRKRWALRKSGG